MEGGVGAVQSYRLPRGRRTPPDELEAGSEFGKAAQVPVGSRNRCQTRNRRLQYAAQGRVDGQFLEAAGEPIRPDGVVGHLTTDVELPAQELQVFLSWAIAMRQSSPYGDEQAVREQPDQDLEQIGLLRSEQGRLVVCDRHFPSDREHPRQGMPDRNGLVALDLREYLDGRAGYREHAHDLAGAKAGLGRAFEDGLRDAQAAGLPLGQCVQPSCVGGRHSVLADREVSPFGNGVYCGGNGHSEASSGAGVRARWSYASSANVSRTLHR